MPEATSPRAPPAIGTATHRSADLDPLCQGQARDIGEAPQRPGALALVGGLALDPLVRRADRTHIDASIHAVIDRIGTSWTDEYRFRRADGSYADILDRGHVTLAQPPRRGFGSRPIERSFAAEVGGEVRLTYAPSGLSCRLEASLASMQEAGVEAAA